MSIYTFTMSWKTCNVLMVDLRTASQSSVLRNSLPTHSLLAIPFISFRMSSYRHIRTTGKATGPMYENQKVSVCVIGDTHSSCQKEGRYLAQQAQTNQDAHILEGLWVLVCQCLTLMSVHCPERLAM
jgi:hypothetical protein